MSWIERTIIVTAAEQSLAQQLAAAIGGPSGEGMFIVPLSPTGESPATHYVSSGPIYEEFGLLLADANALCAAALQAGVDVTLQQCEQLIASSTVQDVELEGALQTFERLGLQMLAG